MNTGLKYNPSYPDQELFLKLVSAWSDPNIKGMSFETSGSTGLPKPINLSKDLIRSAINRSADAFNWQDENVLIPLPIQKTGGIMMVLRALELGWTGLLVEPKAMPLEEIPKLHQFTQISLTPYQLSNCLDDPLATAKLLRFKTVLVGGAPMSQKLEEQVARNNWREGQLVHTYGMTETASHVAYRDLVKTEYTVMNGIDWEIRDGLLWFSDGNFQVQTTDLAEKVSARSFKWLGRTDFVINSGGVKIHPEQLEARISEVLKSVGMERALAVSSKPVADIGSEVVLFLTGTPLKDVSFVMELLKRELPKYHSPKSIVFVDALPRTTNGKLNRLQLREED